MVKHAEFHATKSSDWASCGSKRALRRLARTCYWSRRSAGLL